MKETFLKELKDALVRMEYEDVESILSYFDEMISDKLEAGQSEESIFEELGNPKMIAKEIVLESAQNEVREKPKMKSFDEEMEAPRSANHTYSKGSVRKIEVDAVDATVNIEGTDEEDVELNLVEVNGQNFEVELKDGRLFVSQENTFFGVLNLFKKKEERPSITLFIPKNHDLKKLEVETVSGGITIEGLALENTTAEIHSVSGGIEVMDTQVQKLEAESVSGRVKVERVAGEKVSLESVSGSIKSEDLVAPKIEAETVSGSISLHIDGEESTYRIDLSSIKGERSYNKNAANRLSLESVSGRLEYGFER